MMRPWRDPRLTNAVASALFAMSAVAMLVLIAAWAATRPIHALREVRIEPAPGTELRHVSSLLLGQAVRRTLTGSFFTVDLDGLRAGVEQVPWVRKATIRKVWPDRLEIAIEEHRAFATWGDGRLMNTFGELYAANLAEADEDGPLPHFIGPAGSEQRLLERYEQMRRWVAPLGLRPQSLALSARHAWSARLDDGTRLMLGRDEGLALEERVARWVEAHPRVGARLGERLAVVDLRYPNGFAVRPGGSAGGQASDADPDAEPTALSQASSPTQLAALAAAPHAGRRARPASNR